MTRLIRVNITQLATWPGAWLADVTVSHKKLACDGNKRAQDAVDEIDHFYVASVPHQRVGKAHEAAPEGGQERHHRRLSGVVPLGSRNSQCAARAGNRISV